jgi:cytochrome d ubiquinol oxidase subunit II
MTGAEAVWWILGAAVVVYALTGGADYGGGVWHLLARGPGAAGERRVIEQAIAPVWEANHVWLIFVIVLLFTVFPHAFAVISVALHVPIVIALFGIVLRGSAFVFHAYGVRATGGTWGKAFGVSSLLTPIVLGDILGALSTGAIRWDGRSVTSGFLAGWLTPFALGTGVLATTLFALLAAVYLTVEAEPPLAETFRRRAMRLEVAAGVVAAAVLALAHRDAPALFAGLYESSRALPIHVATAVSALATLLLLRERRYKWARATVAAQAALVVIGWGLAMDGAIVLPDVRIETAGARAEVIGAVVPALAAGALLLVPSLWYLFLVFKRRSSSNGH